MHEANQRFSAAPLAAPSLPTSARPWQKNRGLQFLGALGVVLPMAAITWWVASTGEDISLATMFVGPLLFGTALTAVFLAIHCWLCGDTMQSLGFSRGQVGRDILVGCALAAGALATKLAFDATITPLFPRRPPPAQIIELLQGVVANPILLAIWLGPVVWVGVALFEEVARGVLLRRLWLVVPTRTGFWIAIVSASLLTGLGHWYQGPSGAVQIALKSVLFGWILLRTGRIRILIVGHALYDSIQIIQAVVAIRSLP